MSTNGTQSGAGSSTATHKPRVGLAIQGGVIPAGAFAAGVLKGLVDKGAFAKYDICAFSGTSAGSCVATVCWGNTLNGTIAAIKDDVERQWLHFAWPNHLTGVPNWTPGAASRLMELSAFLMKFPMWRFFVKYSRTPFIRKLMEQWIEDIIPIKTLNSQFMSQYGSANRKARPGLVLGAADVLRGKIKMFREEHLSLQTLMASGSLDDMNGMTTITAPPQLAGTYLDGAWADNPPINELLDYHLDEIWFIQCFSKEAPKPETPAERQQRKDALWQNSLVEHELEFVDTINRWPDVLSKAVLDEIQSLQAQGILPGTSPTSQTLKNFLKAKLDPEGKLPEKPKDLHRLFDEDNNFDPRQYKDVRVKTIATAIPREQGSAFVNAPWFIRNMIDHGYERAGDFVQRNFGAVQSQPASPVPSWLAKMPAPIPHIMDDIMKALYPKPPSLLALMPAPIPHNIDARYPKQPPSDWLELGCDICPWKCAATAWDVGCDAACNNVWGQPFRGVFPNVHATGKTARKFIADHCFKTLFKDKVVAPVQVAAGLGPVKQWLPMCVPH